jgi:hypothetical protein
LSLLLSNLNLCLPTLSATDHNYGITALHNYGFTVLRQGHIIKTYGTQKEESGKNHNFATFRCASSPTHRSHNQENVYGRTHCPKAKGVRRIQAKIRWSCKGRGPTHLGRVHPPYSVAKLTRVPVEPSVPQQVSKIITYFQSKVSK